MAPTRMKLRVRRRDSATGGSSSGAVTGGPAGRSSPAAVTGGGGGGQGEVEEGRSREGNRSRRKTTSSAPRTTAITTTTTTQSEEASPRPTHSVSAEEASPDSKCPICLDRFNNLAYLDSCLHRFCFPCIQEWSNNKAECPLCKQPFSSILHSVRAHDDFKEYTLRPAPSNGSVAATAAMVAAMAERQMRILLRRRREGEGARRRRERGGGPRERGGRRVRGRGRERRRAGGASSLLSHPPSLPPHPSFSPIMPEEEEDEEMERAMMRGRVEEEDPGVIFEGLTGLGGAVNPVAPNDRASRRLMVRLAARRRLQREGGTVRRLREREMLVFRRALYRSGIRVLGLAGVGSQGQQQRDITADGYRRNPALVNRLRPWLGRELTVLYGAHGSLVDIVQRIITSRLVRHGLEDAATIQEELRPFLLARTDHFLHELVSFAHSPLSLENYDLQAVYEPPTPSSVLEGNSSSTDDNSVIAISEGEEEGERGGGESEERRRAGIGEVIQTGSSLSLSAWDDETPGPSYSTAEPSHSPRPLSVSPGGPDLRAGTANQETEEGEWRAGQKEEGEEEVEECLIVGYVKPMAERTPELVQLSSDTEEEEEEKKEGEEKKTEGKRTETFPPLPSIAPSIPPAVPLIHSISPSTLNIGGRVEREGERSRHSSRARSWSDILNGSVSDQSSLCVCSPASPKESEERRERERRISKFLSCASCPDMETDGEEKRSTEGDGRRRAKRSGEKERCIASHNQNPSIYSVMLGRSQYRRSRSPSPLRIPCDSRSPSPRSPSDSPWEYRCSALSSLSSSPASHSVPSNEGHGNHHHGDKPGGKRKYKSRHLDDDPAWQPHPGRQKARSKDGEKERKGRAREKRRGRGRGRRANHGEEGENVNKRRRESRSPSVEIVYEGRAAPQPPPRRKRQKKQHRRKWHNSSAVVITIDSDSSNGTGPPGLGNNDRPIDFSVSDLPALPLVESSGVGADLGVDISELPVDILDQGSDKSGTELDSQSQIMDPVGDDDTDKDVNVEGDDDNCSVLEPNIEDEDGDGFIDINGESLPKYEGQTVRKSTTASKQTCVVAAMDCDTRPCRGGETEIRKKVCNARWERGEGATVGEREEGGRVRERDMEGGSDGEREEEGGVGVREERARVGEGGEEGFGVKECNTIQDGGKETDGMDGEAGVTTSDTRLLATILNDLEGIADPKPDRRANSGLKGMPSVKREQLRSRRRLEQCPLNLDSLGEEKKDVPPKDWGCPPDQRGRTSTSGSGKERFRGHLNLNPLTQAASRNPGLEADLKSWTSRAGPSHGALSFLSDARCSPSTSTDSDRDFCQIIESPSPPCWMIRGSVAEDAPPPPPPPLHRFKDSSGQREETHSRTREVQPPVLKQRERNVSPVSPVSSSRNTPPLLKHKDAGSPASERLVEGQASSRGLLPNSSVDSQPPGARSSPFTSYSSITTSSAGSCTAAIVSPIHLRSDSSAASSKDKQQIPPISTLKRQLASALAPREDNPSASSSSCALISPVDLHPPTYRTSPIEPDSSSSVSHSERWSENDISSRFRSEVKKTSRISPVDSHQSLSVAFHSPSTVSTKDGDTSRVSLKERAAPTRRSPIDFYPADHLSSIDLHSSSSVSRRERLSERDKSSRVEKEKLVSSRNPPIDLHPADHLSSIDFHSSSSVSRRERLSERDKSSRVEKEKLVSSRNPPIDLSPTSQKSSVDYSSSAVSDGERLLESDIPSRVSYKENTIPSRMSPLDSHSTSHTSSIDLHSSSTVCTSETDVFPTHRNSDSGLFWPQNSLSTFNPVNSLLLPSDRPPHPSSVESPPALRSSVDSNPPVVSKLPIESTAPSIPAWKRSQPPDLSSPTDCSFSAFSTAHRDRGPNSKPPVDSYSKSQLPVDSRSKSSSREGGICSQPHTDNHSESSPSDLKNYCNHHSSLDGYSNDRSPIDSGSGLRSPVDGRSDGGAVPAAAEVGEPEPTRHTVPPAAGGRT